MGTKYEGTDQEQLALSAYINLVRAAESLFSRLNQRRSPNALTLGQYMVMDALYFLGPLSQKEIGIKVLKSNGNITMVVQHLERDGLVCRARRPEDQRTMTVRLTPKGQHLMEDLVPQRLQSIVEEMAVLSPKELQMLRRLCRMVGKAKRD
jgi:MarR family 2-MHQ and catechol resistance regulon transcriptional repressor